VETTFAKLGACSRQYVVSRATHVGTEKLVLAISRQERKRSDLSIVSSYQL